METINDVGDQWIQKKLNKIETSRSIPPEVILEKGVLKICSEFTREHPCRSVISIKLLSCKTLLKSHFPMSVLLQICCIFSEHLFLITLLEGCFWTKRKKSRKAFSGCFNLSFEQSFRTASRFCICQICFNGNSTITCYN